MLNIEELSKALDLCKTQQEIENFLRDLCTPQELRALSARLEIAKILSKEKLPYREISERTGASTTTVTRVARFLNKEPHEGYKTILKRMENQEGDIMHDVKEGQKAIERLIAKIEEGSNLSIAWIKHSGELELDKNRSIIKLYQEAFADPPYEEKFTDEEVLRVLRDIVETHGLLFTARERGMSDSSDIIAFTGSVPVQKDTEISNIVSSHINSGSRLSYFAEDAVAKTHRRQGISAHMKGLLLTANWEQGYDAMVLRTSALNIKQISAVAKSGGLPLSGVFQDVLQVRQDNSERTDKRGFYMFSPNNDDIKYEKLERVTVVRPGGNETAFVWDQIPREDQGRVSKMIQAQSPIIEQVMFIEEREDGSYFGQMAGGEFCGNATRSFGYLMLDGQDGTIDVSVSGATEKMRVDVKSGMAKTQIPVRPELNSVKTLNEDGDYIVNLEGISFLITSAGSRFGNRVMSNMADAEKRDQIVKDILGEVSLITKPASGIMIVSEKAGKTSCEPFVFVRDIDTLYYETGCGSGSTSMGMVEAIKSGNSIKDFEIVQPSGLSLYVTINRDSDSFSTAFVDGPVEILEDCSFVLPEQTFQDSQKNQENSGELKQKLG